MILFAVNVRVAESQPAEFVAASDDEVLFSSIESVDHFHCGDVVHDYIVENSVDSAASVEIPILPNFHNFLKFRNAGDGKKAVDETAASFASSCSNESVSCEGSSDEYVPGSAESTETSEDDASEDGDEELSNIYGDEQFHGVEERQAGVLADEAGPNGDENLQVIGAERSVAGGGTAVKSELACPSHISKNGCELDDQNANIIVSQTDNTSGRKYDKRSYCYFCGISQSKLARHLRLKHRHKEKVYDLVNETDKEKRNVLLLTLRNLGNHKHNMAVLEKKEGEIIVIHRPQGDADYQNYVPCRYCYGYLSKNAIWKHNCLLAPKSEDGATVPRIRKGGKELLQQAHDGETIGFSGMMNGMKQDDDGLVAAKDALILQYGRSLCNKFGGDREQFNYIRSKMRQIARLLRHLRKIGSQPSVAMTDFIHPTKFKLMIQAAKECAGFNENAYEKPSSAIKSGGILKRLAEMKQTGALQRGDTAEADSCTQFIKLCKLNWANEVSSVASRNLSDRKRLGVLVIPLTEDIMKLNEFLTALADTNIHMVAESSEAFMSLTQVTLAKVLLFNRKRQGEVSRIK